MVVGSWCGKACGFSARENPGECKPAPALQNGANGVLSQDGMTKTRDLKCTPSRAKITPRVSTACAGRNMRLRSCFFSFFSSVFSMQGIFQEFICGVRRAPKAPAELWSQPTPVNKKS